MNARGCACVSEYVVGGRGGRGAIAWPLMAQLCGRPRLLCPTPPTPQSPSFTTVLFNVFDNASLSLSLIIIPLATMKVAAALVTFVVFPFLVLAQDPEVKSLCTHSLARTNADGGFFCSLRQLRLRPSRRNHRLNHRLAVPRYLSPRCKFSPLFFRQSAMGPHWSQQWL